MYLKLWLLVENILALIVRLPKALFEYVRDWLHFRKLANRFPGPPTLPLVGNLFNCGFFPKPWTLISWVLEDVMYRYPAGQIMIGPVRVILLSDVNDIQTFLMNSKNQERPKPLTDALAYCLGRGLGTINGAKWSQHHKILGPCFHKNLLRMYVPVIDQKCEIFVQLLDKNVNGTSFDVKHMSESLEIDIIIESLFGVPSNLQLNPDQEMFEIVISGQETISHRIIRPWLYVKKIYELSTSGRKAMDILNWLRRYVDSIAEQRREIHRREVENSTKNETVKQTNGSLDSTSDAEVTSNKKQFNILIDVLLQQDGRSISHKGVVDELLTFLITGFDTTSITLQFALYFLAKNPHVQEKAVRELRDIFDAAGSTEVTPDTLQRMQYVEMIVNETLRMHPPLFFFVKNAGVDTPLTSCDLVVPERAIVTISPRTVHYDPKLYPDPDVFDPERFSPENSAKRNPCAFIPFGIGMRSCIGRKYAMLILKTSISKVIWNYHIQPDETYEPQLQWGVTTLTSNGMRIKLLKRSAY